MSEYIRQSRGPGSIAALLPGAALWHPPTISSNNPRGAMYIANDHIIGREIKVRAGATKGFADPEQPNIQQTHGAQPICCLREGEDRTMSEYIRKTYGPGDIASLPPTIGMTSRAPTIGAEDIGHRIKPVFPFQSQYAPGATRVRAAGVKLPRNGFGLGTESSGTSPAWLLPVGIGIVLGGLYVMFAKQREHGGIFPNPKEPISKHKRELLAKGQPAVLKISYSGRLKLSGDVNKYVHIAVMLKDPLTRSIVYSQPFVYHGDNYNTREIWDKFLDGPLKVNGKIMRIEDMSLKNSSLGGRGIFYIDLPYAERDEMPPWSGIIERNQFEPTCSSCGPTPNPRRRLRRNG